MMIYAAAVIAALALIGGILWLLARGAERRQQARRDRRGITAGGSAFAATIDGASTDSGGCDNGGGGCD